MIYPDAVRRERNGARKAAMMCTANKSIDDVGFIRALVEPAITDHDVDPNRVYVAGFSLGGQMTIRLIHEIPDVVAEFFILSHPTATSQGES